jgi:uncharacterized protein (UPF0333 family)
VRSGVNFLVKDQSGAALVIALVLMIVLTLIGLASTLSSTYEIRLSGNKRGSTDAFYAADSGAQVVITNVNNFDVPGKYTTNKYEPFKDNSNPNPNPTNAQVVIEHYPDQFGCPRGFGFGSHVDCLNYMIESNGEDQIELSLMKSKCTVQEKVARLIPKEGD